MANKKGPQFERDCAKRLSLWLSENERDDLVWRTSASGGRFTQRKKYDKDTYNQAGDLCANNPRVQYFFDYILVECKNGYTPKKGKKAGYAVISVLQGLDKLKKTREPILYSWWVKAVQECKDAGRRHAIILFKRTSRNPCVLMEKRLILELSKYNGRYTHNTILIKLETYPILTICDLEQWLNWCAPQSIEFLKNAWKPDII